jgi:D-alanyl-D-alanine dipeptidase
MQKPDVKLITEISEDYEPDLQEPEHPPQITQIDARDGLLFDTRFTSERRIRSALYDRLVAARQHLPDGVTFKIYEAYRPRARQQKLWDGVFDRLRKEHPDLTPEAVAARTRSWVADPNGVGSGHLFAAAVDVTLHDTATGVDLDMGCDIQAFDTRTATWSAAITEAQRANRLTLVTALACEGVLNYPPEWWHFSYGDRIWAILQRRPATVFKPVPDATGLCQEGRTAKS